MVQPLKFTLTELFFVIYRLVSGVKSKKASLHYTFLQLFSLVNLKESAHKAFQLRSTGE